jgi:hypothetical protein
MLRVVRLGSANIFDGIELRALSERSRLVRTVRSAKVSGRNVN